METAAVNTFIQHSYRKLLQWYASHTAREKLLLTIFAITIVSLLFTYKVWLPMQQALDEAQRTYSEKQDLLQWMEHKEPQVKQRMGSLAETHEKQPLPIILTDTAKEFDITIKRLELDKSGSVNLSLERVPFAQLIGWLDALAHAHDVGVQSLTITKTDLAGSVNAAVQIK